jgi:hypothetical protein
MTLMTPSQGNLAVAPDCEVLIAPPKIRRHRAATINMDLTS